MAALFQAIEPLRDPDEPKRTINLLQVFIWIASQEPGAATRSSMATQLGLEANSLSNMIERLGDGVLRPKGDDPTKSKRGGKYLNLVEDDMNVADHRLKPLQLTSAGRKLASRMASALETLRR